MACRVFAVDFADVASSYVDGPVGWSHAVASVGGQTDPLALARACFLGAPIAVRTFLVVGWRLLLLEGPARSDAGRVLGWPVVSSSPSNVVLRRRSGLGLTSSLVLTVDAGRATFATGIVFSNPAARLVWAVVAPVHRGVVRYLLGRACRDRV